MTKRSPLTRSRQFAEALQNKFDHSHTTGTDAVWRYRFNVEAGQRFDRIYCTSWIERSMAEPQKHDRIFCFIDRTNQGVLKPEGYRKPATRLGYYEPKYDLSNIDGFREAIDNADPYGGFLYADYKKKEEAVAQ